jgi:hypothetical protein
MITLKRTATTTGNQSPLIVAGAYFLALVVMSIIALAWPDHMVSALVVLAIWLGATIAFFVVVTWYRDDDWLASGFLLGVTVILGDTIGAAIASALVTGSIGPLVVAAPSAFLGVLTRGIIIIPVAGGAVAAARWIGVRWRSGGR